MRPIVAAAFLSLACSSAVAAAQRAPIDFMFPPVGGARFTFQASGSEEAAKGSLAVSDDHGGHQARIFTIHEPGSGRKAFQAWFIGGQGKTLSLSSIAAGEHFVDLGDDPLALSEGVFVPERMRSSALPSWTAPDTDGQVQWRLQVRPMADVEVGDRTFQACVRYRIGAADISSGERVAKFELVLAPGVGVVAVRGEFRGQPLDFGLTDVSWPWGRPPTWPFSS